MNATSSVKVRQAQESDMPALGGINGNCFSGNDTYDSAVSWMKARFYNPAFRIWIAYSEPWTFGYITWEIKGGWKRELPVMELEQIGIHGSCRGRGIGHILVEQTLGPVAQWIRDTNENANDTASIIVWTTVNNEAAKKLYRNFFPNIRGIRHQYQNRPSEYMFQGTILLPNKNS